MLDLKSLNQVNDLRLLPSNVLSESNIGVRVHQTFDIEEDAYTRKKGWYEVALNRYYVAVSDPESSSYNTSSPQYQSDKDSSNIEGQNRKDGTASVEPYYIPNSNDKIIFEKSYDGYIEQIYDLEESRIIPSEDTINQRVYCLKSEPAKKFAPMWYKVGEQDISPIDWDDVCKFKNYDPDDLGVNNIVIGITSSKLLDNYIQSFVGSCDGSGVTEDTSLYFILSIELSNYVIEGIEEPKNLLKNRLYKFTYKASDGTVSIALADSTSMFVDGVLSNIYNHPTSASDIEEWFFKGSSLVVKNSMIGKYIYIYQDSYFRPAIYPCFYEVKESLTTPGEYQWVEVNDTWEVDDVRKLDWMLSLEYEGYQVFQFRSVEENTVDDPDYYFIPRGTYIVSEKPSGGYEWKQMMDSNIDIEFPDIDSEDVTNQFLRESMVGYRLYQTNTTYEDPDPITEEMPVKRSKGWYEVVEVFPLFPDRSVVQYEYKVAGGDRGYVTSVDFTHVEVGAGWKIQHRDCWENENTAFCRMYFENVGTSEIPASRILLKKLPGAIETINFLAESKQTSSTNWDKIAMEISQSGNLRIHDELDVYPKEIYIDLWYICEEKDYPILVSVFGIDASSMKTFKDDIQKYAMQAPYKIKFKKVE